MGGNIFNQNFLLVAKAAANARFNDPNSFDRKPQNRRHLPPNVERHLCARPNHQPIVLIPIGQGNMRLNMRLLHFGNSIFLFKDPVSLSKALFNIANVYANFGCKVDGRIRIGKIDIFAFIMNLNRAFLHRIARIDNYRKRFVGYINQRKCLFGNFGGFRGNKCHPIPDESHLVIQREHIQRTRNRVRLTRRRVNHTRKVFPGHHRRNTWKGFGFGSIDAHDPGMGVG